MRLPTIHQGVNRRNVEYFAENRGCYAFQENFGRTFEHPNLIHASYSLLVDFTSSEENSFKKKNLPNFRSEVYLSGLQVALT